jgi:hypothetical protein
MWDLQHLTTLLPVNGIALLFYMKMMSGPHRKHPWTLTACYEDILTFLYVDDVRTSQETHLRDSTACDGDIVAILYVDNTRTSQETHLWALTACYEDIITFICK